MRRTLFVVMLLLVATAINATPDKYRAVIAKEATQHNVDAALIVALIDQETGGTWDVKKANRNPNGTFDIGLAQANSKYLSYYKEKFDLNNPRSASNSIHFCAAYLAYLYKHTGAWFSAIVAYKCGLTGTPSLKTAQAAFNIMEEAKRYDHL